MATKLSPREIERLDPYQLMAVLGKRVIHPGGRRSTEELFELLDLRPEHRVLEVGCGVGTTAIDIVRRFACTVTAVDVDDAMVAAARENVRRAGVGDHVTVERADIQSLPFDDESFDRVIVEAVTMFVNRERAAAEVVRVCRRGGRIGEHELIWRSDPPPVAKRVFEGEICPGIDFDSAADWQALYERAGLGTIRCVTGPFAMMTPRGFVRDEGIGGTLRFAARTVSRLAHIRKMAWMMRRMMRSIRHLGYVVLVGERA